MLGLQWKKQTTCKNGSYKEKMELLRKNPKEMREINTVTEVKNAFDGDYYGTGLAEERILSLRIQQQKFSNRILKSKEERLKQIEHYNQNYWTTTEGM